MLLKVVPLGRVENLLKFIVFPFKRQLIPSSAFIGSSSSVESGTEAKVHIVWVFQMGIVGPSLWECVSMFCGWLTEISSC